MKKEETVFFGNRAALHAVPQATNTILSQGTGMRL